jgi:carbon storage regulator
MLVLSRKVGERIVLPDSRVTVTVLEVKGSTVRIGVSAPPEVSVHREEVWQRLRRPAAPAEAP